MLVISDGDAEKIQKHLTQILGRMISILDTKARDEQKENFYHGLLLPLGVSKVFTTAGNFQTSVDIKRLQGERQFAKRQQAAWAVPAAGH